MAYESYCASCTYLGEKEDCGKYWCEAYRRSNSSRENMYNISARSSGGGCYLTTAMCNILGYPDGNYYLQTLRTFRDTVLKLDVKYLPLLLSYDVIGPQIAFRLSNDTEKEKIAKTLLNQYISKAVKAIEEKKYAEATNIYVAMTHTLAKKYNIDTRIVTIDSTNIDIKELGHGRARKIIPTNSQA